MRTAIALLATAAALCAMTGAARADQCAWLDDADAVDRASRELARATQVIEYCEPCGERAPGEPAEVGSVSIREVDHGLWEIMLDERGIDLAYTYVLAPGASEYRNLAALAGCPAEGVSPSLRIDAATASGVLIFPDSAPVPQVAPVAPVAPVAEIAPAPVVAAPGRPATAQPYVIVVADGGAQQLALLYLLIGGLISANGLLLLMLFRRRSRGDGGLPRATVLADRGRRS